MKINLHFSGKWTIRGFFMLVCLLIISTMSSAQGVAMNTTLAPANAAAGLDIDFATKGFLIPRVALTGTGSFAPLGATHIIGMIVYNTVTTADVTPGLYYNNGAKWVSTVPPKGISIGNMLYWDGTAWIIIPVGTPGQKLKLIAGVPTWGN